MQFNSEITKPSREVFLAIKRDLQQSAHIAAVHFSEFMKLTQIVILSTSRNETIAVGGIQEISKDMCEIGPLIVTSQFRSMGLGKVITQETINHGLKSYSQAILLTQNPAMVHILESIQLSINQKKIFLLPFEIMLYLAKKFMNVRRLLSIISKPSILFRKQYIFVIRK